MQLRRVAGCVPILLAPFSNNLVQRLRECPSGDTDCLTRISLAGSKLLFTNSRKNPGYYVFPKGGVKRREDPQEAAQRETLEETGVEGTVFGEIGKKKWSWFLLSVQQIHDDWLEKDQRERVWVPYEEALSFEPVTKDTKYIIETINELYKQPKHIEHIEQADPEY